MRDVVARLLSLNTGLPADVPWQGRTVHTGIVKRPVDGPRMVRRLNVDGDGQGDLGGHGGEVRAVLVYQHESYEHWRRHLGRDDLEPGRFGENFTVEGLPDDEVHIGDRYRVGDAEFEVTQPRVTCFRLGLRLDEPRMPALLVAHHRPGFYLRVITEGLVRAGDEIVRTRVGRHRMSVAEIDALLYLPDRSPDRLRLAVDVPALSPGWRGSFEELLRAADQPPEPEGWAGFRPLRVTRIVPETPTITSFHLASPDGAPLPRAKPGQHLTVRVGEPPSIRSYSLSGTGYRISVKREPHGLVGTFLHTRLRVGDTVDVAAPRGEFVLADDDAPVLLISAGVGVTPVLAMLHALVEAGGDREVWWLHTARSRAEHAFADEAEDLLARLPRGHGHVRYTAEHPDTPADLRAREALAGLALPTTATAYVCGPTAFMTDMRTALGDLGIDRVHTEAFGALAALTPGIIGGAAVPPHQPPGPAGTGPRITFARSGLAVDWREDYPTVLDLAEACDVPTRWSCRTGVCHTCRTPVLSGTAHHRPEPLEAPPAGTVLLCCAQPETDLALDL